MATAPRSTPTSPAERLARSHARWRAVGSWSIALALLWWALRRVSWPEIAAACAQLSAAEITVLLAFNLLALPLFGLRWWLICRTTPRDGRDPALRQPVGLFDITVYRWAAFGLSYLTPGPLVGGEPLQVILLERRHSYERSRAIASVMLDRTLEWTISFGALLAAGVFLLSSLWRPSELNAASRVHRIGGLKQLTGLASEGAGLVPAVLALSLLVALPLLYFTLLARGRRPASALAHRVLRPRDPASGLGVTLRESESLVARWLREQRPTFVAAILVSLLGFAAVLVEFILVVKFLDLPVTFDQILLAFVAARLAQLALLPGALGALEASQLLSWRAAGLLDAVGLAVSLVVRARDLLFAVTGLLLGLLLLHRSPVLERSPVMVDRALPPPDQDSLRQKTSI